MLGQASDGSVKAVCRCDRIRVCTCEDRVGKDPCERNRGQTGGQRLTRTRRIATATRHRERLGRGQSITRDRTTVTLGRHQ